MNRPASDDLWALTEKEKQTLRLIVRGHDAKSTARNLGLSVHTINERLREARRKMAVSSSREAARLLLAAESGDATPASPQLLGDATLGADPAQPPPDQEDAPISGAGRRSRRPWSITGGLLMMLALGLLAFTALSQIGSGPSPAPDQTAATTTADAAAVNAARQWLALVDQGRWTESYRATGTAFRRLNTSRRWAAASETVRTPLGAVISRTFLSEEALPAPPQGFDVVKFRTSFANKSDAIETVALDREQGRWRVVGITIT